MLFSIIIPVYNKAEFLASCLESILNQSYTNFEIICVDDGSTDNSLEILESYREKDSRIKVFSQENKGASATRNFGIEKAQGKYLLFCDADDKFKPELCEIVAKEIESNPVDVIAYGHEDYVDGTLDSIKLYDIQELKRKNNLENWLNLQIYIWEKAFRREFILENEILFPVGIKSAEDVVFCLLVYLVGARYALIERALYEYKKEIKGVSTFSNSNGIENDIVAYKYLTQTKVFKKLTTRVQCAVTNFFIRGSIRYFKTHKDSEYEEKVFRDLQNLHSIILEKYLLNQCIKMKNFRAIHKILFKQNNKRFFSKLNIIKFIKIKVLNADGVNLVTTKKKKVGVYDSRS